MDGYRCWICNSSKALTQHHVIKRSQGGKDQEWNLIWLCWIDHMIVHMIEHPDTLFQRVERVQKGSSKHKRFKRAVSQLSKDENRDKILKLREIIRLVSTGYNHIQAITAVYPLWLEEEKWKSQSPTKDLLPLLSPSESVLLDSPSSL